MQNLKYPRGSEWRRWDLHVHTPYSALNNQFGDNFDAYAKELFTKAVEKEVAVIGVTDYFLIDGYKQLKALQQNDMKLDGLIGKELGDKAREILLLPNIELRLSVLVGVNRVNFHVIFSDAVDEQTIEENFLHRIEFTAESSPGRPDDKWSLTRANLEALGKRLKQEHKPFQEDSDICVGMKNAVIMHEDVTKILDSQPSRFKDRYLIVLPADEDLSKLNWNGQDHQTRKIPTQKAHMFFSANAGTREFGLGLKHPTPRHFVDEFQSLKPCIHGSDSHSFKTLFEPDAQRYLWIKADPTFQGLQQLLHMPEDRVYIGEKHPSLDHEKQNATRYFDKLHFERTEMEDPSKIWFNGEIFFNHGLVAIIGNKGSGKSALADILGLLGNTSNSKDFSFLCNDRFLQKKEKLGSMFRATLTWYSGSPTEHLLNNEVEQTASELVKYIPQNFLENICSGLKQFSDGQFYNEIMEVIFSHVEEAERLGKETLPELIDYITSEKAERINQITDSLKAVNVEIVGYEEQLTPTYRKTLEAQLDQKREELKAHDDSKPKEVPEPNHDAAQKEATALIKKELATFVEQWETLDEQIDNTKNEMRAAALKIAASDRLLTRIENLERQIASFHMDSASDSGVLSLNLSDIVELTINRKPILDVKEKEKEQEKKIKDLLNITIEGSLVYRHNEIKMKTEACRAKLDEPNRHYQEYLHQLAEWQKRHILIEGTASEPQSVKGLESKLSALENLPGKIMELKTRRFGFVKEILETKQELLEDYRKLYSPVQEFIVNHPVAQRQKFLEFAANLVVDGFEHGLLEMIHKGRKGSFQGEEGAKRLQELVENSSFNSNSTLEKFLADVQDHLENDKRPEGGGVLQVRDQLVQGKTPTDIYNFLYGLTYLKPQFELRWQGKSLGQLSQGERGSLLLVFYLLIDKRDIPLIIDQPEENLDNQSVVKMLVPAIKYAKRRRQVVLVTHNPNLAVVCDADQIIHAHHDKTDGNRVTYTTGSIEEPAITKLIIDVLEGTKPAFDIRDARYKILEN